MSLSTAKLPVARLSARAWLHLYWPGLLCAASFGISDIANKFTFNAGTSVYTLAVARGVLGLVAVGAWLLISRPRPQPPGARRTSLWLGLAFAGNILAITAAIQEIPVPFAVLTYFVYPLLTGLAAAALGIETLGLTGLVATLAAFAGLAAMLGTRPAGMALTGIGLALGAAIFRVVVLLVSRVRLTGADARLTSLYTLLSATFVFSAMALLLHRWAWPAAGIANWAWFFTASITTTISWLALFVSTARIGAIRTALAMNLEPLISTTLSYFLLGTLLSPVQIGGAVVMLVALAAFQYRQPATHRQP